MIVSFAVLAGLKIELQRYPIPHGGDGGLDRCLGERSAAEICARPCP